uniref:Uncharacterized protein n=1 Tax=Arundo donax TaxID=35708 RepID=A0A0A8ZXP3_ARUDO
MAVPLDSIRSFLELAARLRLLRLAASSIWPVRPHRHNRPRPPQRRLGGGGGRRPTG